MNIYLFDEKRWYQDDSDAYADFLEGAVTDLIILVYGAWQGGVTGYKSEYIDSTPGIPTNKLQELIDAMCKRGINVHAAFNTCLVNKLSPFQAHTPGSRFVDVHNLDFQVWISNLMSECSQFGVRGICFDYVKTDDYSDFHKNDCSIEGIVGRAYKQIKFGKPDCVISSTTTPYIDLTHPELIKAGRKAIAWANSGCMDIIFDMNYGNRAGDYGDPPDMNALHKARELTKTPVIPMVSSYEVNSNGDPVPTGTGKFAEVLNTTFLEKDLAIYTGWLFTEKQADLLKQVYGQYSSKIRDLIKLKRGICK